MRIRTLGIAVLSAAGLASCGEVAEPRRAEASKAAAPAAEKQAESGKGGRPAAGPVAPPVVAPKPAADPDDAFREKIVGVWRQEYTGVRWLSVRPDGTATMIVDPDWIAKAIIGSRLTMTVEWKIEDGRALLRSVSGEPKSAFDAVNALFGRERDRPIAELTDRTFVLLDEEDGSRSEWRRVAAGEPRPPEFAE